MTRDPIRRRFGHGAARLPLGMPPGSERLSERARRPVQHERRLTLALPLIAACVAALVVSVLQPVRTESPPAAGEIQIVLDAWPAKPLPDASPQLATLNPRATPARPQPASPVPLAVARRATPSPAPPAGSPSESAPRAQFDPGALATRAPEWSDETILPAPREAGSASRPARAAGQPTRANGSGPMPAGLANAPRSHLTAPSLESAAFDASRFAGTGDRRPHASGTGSGSSAGLAASGRGDQERSAFLATVERESGATGRGTGAAPSTRRPVVSAARAALPALSSGSNGSNGDGVDGWQEVPLDALPDCSPPGRQDLLKKRILLAAPFQRECSHQGGSYRFVETRNLGAFLMWSRPNPDGWAGQPRDRDACDVLERALACIGDRSSQESSPR